MEHDIEQLNQRLLRLAQQREYLGMIRVRARRRAARLRAALVRVSAAHRLDTDALRTLPNLARALRSAIACAQDSQMPLTVRQRQQVNSRASAV